METIKRKIDDRDGAFKFIFDNAFGNPVIFTAQPTNDTMRANTWGFFSDELYVKFANNSTLKFTGTVVS